MHDQEDTTSLATMHLRMVLSICACLLFLMAGCGDSVAVFNPQGASTGAGGGQTVATTTTTGGGGEGGAMTPPIDNPESCPEDAPMEDTSCGGGQGASWAICTYPERTCRCRFGRWRCYDCPGDVPTEGSECSGGSSICSYGKTTCGCFQGDWYCQTCPAERPSGSCDQPGAWCRYEGESCGCWQGEWNCF